MLKKDGFYADDTGAYIIGKMTEKTVTFIPVKSVFINYGDVSSAFLYDTVWKATKEIDESRENVRFKLSNNTSRAGLATFYESKKGRLVGMYELENDTFTVEHNYG